MTEITKEIRAVASWRWLCILLVTIAQLIISYCVAEDLGLPSLFLAPVFGYINYLFFGEIFLHE